MGKTEQDATGETGQEKDDLPASSQLDLDADQSAQTSQMLRSLVGAKEIDALRMSVPAFIHQGDSSLERNYNVWQPQLFFEIADAATPVLRMKAVVAFMFSSLQGLLGKKNKKPFNPILGEMYLARSPQVSGHQVFYYAEQVSHHPPITAFHYEVPTKELTMFGVLHPRGSFTGTALRMMFEEPWHIRVGALDETYTLNMPTWYLRGILFGKSFMDINGDMVINCEKTGVKAVITFKPKPWFFGDYRKVEGQITDKDGSVLYTYSGKWSDVVTIKDVKNKHPGILQYPVSTGSIKCNFGNQTSETLVDLSKLAPIEPIMSPIEEQGAMESQRLWRSTAEAIREKKWKEADRSKGQLEERQRIYIREVEKNTIKHVYTLFDKTEDGRFVFKPATAHRHHHRRHHHSEGQAPTAENGKAAESTTPSDTSKGDAAATTAIPAQHRFTVDDLAGWIGALDL